MKKQYLFLLASMMAVPTFAQETYENARLTGSDLNGTARYVGMGGAMEALGADISTIGSNPAGIGLFRRSMISVSGGLLTQQNTNSFADENKTNVSFDQIGVVYAAGRRRRNQINFGFNYHKSKNFNQILMASNRLNGSSQNKQSYLKGLLGSQANGGFSVGKTTDGYYNGYYDDKSNSTAGTWSQLDYLYWNTLIPDSKTGNFYAYDAESFQYGRSSNGYISNYDFNISGSYDNTFYWGLTFGLKDVNYHAYSEYTEQFSKNLGNVRVTDERKITGSGFDITAGIIVRPVENSPFRLGAYVKTPTWYDLTTRNYTTIANNATEGGTYDNGKVENLYDYKIWTPWKFGFSLGHTIGDFLALGFTYEYEDHSAINTRVNDGTYVDYYYGDIYETTVKDAAMNRHTEKSLKGVSTIKAGIEYKPTRELSLRAGYNYVSPKYNESAQKATGLASYGTSYSSATDYTNWEATNRFTLGAGYQHKQFSIDLAYQYSAQKGKFYPFSDMSVKDATTTYTNTAPATEVKNDKSQLLLTLGYRF
ncbi:MAG: hemin receptor [Prevotella sp.]|nr:hemin receptor [Prevotella sp.]MDY4218302.1 hemin receptor [Prevotella sp.]